MAQNIPFEKMTLPQKENQLVKEISTLMYTKHEQEFRTMASKALLGHNAEPEKFKILMEKFYNHFEAIETKQMLDESRFFKAPRQFERTYFYWKTLNDYMLGRGESIDLDSLAFTHKQFILWVEIEAKLRDVPLNEIMQVLCKKLLKEEYDGEIKKQAEPQFDYTLINKYNEIIKIQAGYLAERQQSIEDVKRVMKLLRESAYHVRSGNEMKNMVDKYMSSIPHCITYTPRRQPFKQSTVVKKGNTDGNRPKYPPLSDRQVKRSARQTSISRVSQVSKADNKGNYK